MDARYEEDEEIFVHPRDPYKRVDVMQSSRHMRIVVAGEVMAETLRPRLLFETNHPTRYYLPPEDVRADLLLPSSTVTRSLTRAWPRTGRPKSAARLYPTSSGATLIRFPSARKSAGFTVFSKNERPWFIWTASSSTRRERAGRGRSRKTNLCRHSARCWSLLAPPRSRVGARQKRSIGSPHRLV